MGWWAATCPAAAGPTYPTLNAEQKTKTTETGNTATKQLRTRPKLKTFPPFLIKAALPPQRSPPFFEKAAVPPAAFFPVFHKSDILPRRFR